MIKKTVIVLSFILFLFFGQNIVAQNDDAPKPKSMQTKSATKPERKIKFAAGGNFGLQFGSYTSISLAPLFGIYPIDWMLVGVEGVYMYSRYDRMNIHDFGGSVFAEAFVWKKRLIFHVGLDYLNVDVSHVSSMKRMDAFALAVGPGYRQAIGDNMNLYLLILFNVWQTNSQYLSFPFVYPKIGFTIDF